MLVNDCIQRITISSLFKFDSKYNNIQINTVVGEHEVRDIIHVTYTEKDIIRSIT